MTHHHRRTVRLLLTFTAALCLFTGAIHKPAAAIDGPADNLACQAAGGPILGTIANVTGVCDKVSDNTVSVVKGAWKGVWDSVLGEFINAGKDIAKWMIRTTLEMALLGPSVDLEATGLFGEGAEHATLPGMLVWLGLVFAAGGMMWQLGKMAVTGQMKYAGQALSGWVENALLTGFGLTFIVLLLRLGDQITEGLVQGTFGNSGAAYDRIVAVMIPAGIANPAGVAGVVLVLLIIGFIQLILIFLRQSAIPIQCMLLPIAGAGRVGGDATRKWAPRLITSILVVIAYKPILAMILCVGFAEFGKSETLAEWLRGVATLVLAVLAPGPLTRLFTPFGEEVGAGLASGGAVGAVASAGAFVATKGTSGGGGEAAEPASAAEQARRVEQTMPRSYRDGGQEDPGGRGEAAEQAGRNDASQANGTVPQAAGAADQSATAGTSGTAGSSGAEGGDGDVGGTGGDGGTGGAGGTGGGGLELELLDGVNSTAGPAPGTGVEGLP